MTWISEGTAWTLRQRLDDSGERATYQAGAFQRANLDVVVDWSNPEDLFGPADSMRARAGVWVVECFAADLVDQAGDPYEPQEGDRIVRRDTAVPRTLEAVQVEPIDGAGTGWQLTCNAVAD